MDHRQAADAGVELMFCNSYHLLLQPGPDIIEQAGGLHKFVNRSGPIITDSGGFQVFSLAYGSVHQELAGAQAGGADLKARKASNRRLLERGSAASVLQISEEGCLFRSYYDGKKVLLTPESSVAAQKAYGSDIIIPLDELPPYHIDEERLRKSVHLSHRWMARSLRAHLADPRAQAMYAVVHGGLSRPLRQLSIDYLTQLPFDGFCVGGSLGKNREELVDLLKFVMPRLPQMRPNHLLGIADTLSIAECIPLGVDTFDSSFPTKLARHGTLLTWSGRLHIRKAQYARAYGPVEEGCPCSTCTNHTLAYLHHLHRAREPMGAVLNTVHNVSFMIRLMRDYREKILNDEL